MIADHQIAFFRRELAAPDPARRAAAAKGLSHAPGHVPELDALAADPVPEVRRRAVNALLRRDATAPETIAALLRRVEDAELRNRPAVLEHLLRAGTPPPAASLVPLLAADDSRLWGHARLLLRLLPEADAVLAGLVRTGPPQARDRALDALARPSLGVPGLTAPDQETREAAWRAHWTPSPRIRQALLDALAAETVPRARTVLLNALAARRVTEAAPPAAAWLDDPDCGPAAAAALAGAGTTEAVALLRRYALTPGPARTAALRGLGASGALPDAKLLLTLLDDPAEPVRLDATAALAAFFHRFDGGTHDRLDHWHAARTPSRPPQPPSTDPGTRALARRTAERLTRMLVADPQNADTYHNALWHLPETKPLLPALLKNPHGRVRSTALHLAEHFGALDLPARLGFLRDPHPHVRQGAAMAFLLLARKQGLTPDEQRTARPHLEARGTDPDRYVRAYTAKALELLTPPTSP